MIINSADVVPWSTSQLQFNVLMRVSLIMQSR